MLTKNLFRRPRIALEDAGGYAAEIPAIPEEMYSACPKCKNMLASDELEQSAHVCTKCAHHFRIGARRRIDLLSDSGSFEEMWAELRSANPIEFPDYTEKLAQAEAKSGEVEGVITGVCTIGGEKCCIFAMEAGFIMGSMGEAVGEKITRLFEYARDKRLNVVGCCVSGGARMQEGMVSLMQMAKTTAAIKRHSDCGGLYVAILTDPTTGGVTASFAMEGDITIAEPGALIGFAGPRVIEQTIRQKLKPDFQKAEFVLEKGFLDMICDRRELKQCLHTVLYLHRREECE